MTHLPRIERIRVSGYEMYPGTTEAPGLDRILGPGLTLIVGANGLGKTTLVTLLRHLCAGPYRLSNRGGNAFEAGRLRVTAIDGGTFADRVADRAADATAQITMAVGVNRFVVTRELQHLALRALEIDGTEVSPATEDAFRSAVVRASGVSDYGDWLLTIDHLLFVTEDRILPFWDRNVQRQLLRVLTRDAISSGALSAAESRHISADSEFRNARAQLARHRQRFEAASARAAGSGDLNDALAKSLVERDAVDERIGELQAALEVAEDLNREAARDMEVADHEFELATGQLEAARLALIESTMPTQDDVIRYLQARLATDDACPACGQQGGRLDTVHGTGECFLCGLTLDVAAAEVDPSVLSEAEAGANRAKIAAEAAQHRAIERADIRRAAQVALATERSRRADVEASIKALRAQLPDNTQDLASTASLIADLEADLESLRNALEASRQELQQLLHAGNEAVRARQDDIKRIFDDVATRFLVEPCHLVPHETLLRIGQEGDRFPVQAFDLDLGSATVLGEARRDTADDVSESQRVFIDVAFRIALIRGCAESGSGTLVIDAPEGSLDAVFAANAAALLATFIATPDSGNRLVAATNLIEGSLLPALARIAGVESQEDERLIDLLEVAAPTTAVRERRDEYDAVLRMALQRAGSGREP